MCTPGLREDPEKAHKLRTVMGARKAEPVSLFERIQKTKAHRLRTVMGEKRVFLAFSEHGGVG